MMRCAYSHEQLTIDTAIYNWQSAKTQISSKYTLMHNYTWGSLMYGQYKMLPNRNFYDMLAFGGKQRDQIEVIDKYKCCR